MCRQTAATRENDQELFREVDTAKDSMLPPPSEVYSISAWREEATPALYSNVNRSVVVGLSYKKKTIVHEKEIRVPIKNLPIHKRAAQSRVTASQSSPRRLCSDGVLLIHSMSVSHLPTSG